MTFGNTFLGDDAEFHAVSGGGGTASLDWINISQSPYNASTSASDNSAAIQAAISAAQTAGVPLYIPSGIWKYKTTLTFNAQNPCPIFGDGKTKSILVYTDSNDAISYSLPSPATDIFVSQNSAYSNSDGHQLRDFAIEPSTGGGGLYGIHIIPGAAGTYNYFHWERVRVGQFGTASVFLDNSGSNFSDCIANGTFDDCDFINSITATNIGDSVKFDNCRFDGTATATFSQHAGAGSLVVFQGSITTTGGMYFNGCGSNTSLILSEFEIFVVGYTGARNAQLAFNNCTTVNVLYSNIGLVDLGTKPNDAMLFTNCTLVQYGGNIIAKGNNNHVRDDVTNTLVIDLGSNIYTGGEATSHGGGTEFTRFLGDNTASVGDASYSVKRTDRVIYLNTGTITANRTWTLPALSTCVEGQRFLFCDFGGGLGGSHHITLTTSGSDTFQGGGTTVTFNTQGGRIELISSAGAGIWFFGAWVPQSGGVGDTTLSAYNTNTATSGTALTTANITGGLCDVTLAMTGTLGANSNASLPTVGTLFSSLPNPNGLASYRLRVINESSANFSWTITTSAGWSLNGTMSIAQNTWRDFVITFTSSSTATFQNIGTGTFS